MGVAEKKTIPWCNTHLLCQQHAYVRDLNQYPDSISAPTHLSPVGPRTAVPEGDPYQRVGRAEAAQPAGEVEDGGGGGGADPLPAGGGAAEADHRDAQGVLLRGGASGGCRGSCFSF